MSPQVALRHIDNLARELRTEVLSQGAANAAQLAQIEAPVREIETALDRRNRRRYALARMRRIGRFSKAILGHDQVG